MKLFQQVHKFHQLMATFMPQSNQNYKQNLKTLLFFFSYMLVFISSFAFFLFQAKSLHEQIETLSLPVSEIISAIYILIYKWKMVDILKLIDGMEQFIAKSK